MANTQGGTIVLGVAEKSTGLVWEGVPDAAQLRTVLWGQLNDRHKVSTNLLRDDDVRTVEDEGRQFVVVSVPRASRLQRPVFVGPNPIPRTCRHRLGESAVSVEFATKNVASCAHSTWAECTFILRKSVARALSIRVEPLAA